MKYVALFFVVLLAACTTLTNAEKEELAAKKAQAIEQSLAGRRYTISVTSMNPIRGNVRQIAPDYSLTVKGDTIISYLPYFGRAYNVPYGGGKGLNFTAPIKKYQSVKGRKGDTIIELVVDNSEDILTYRLDISSDGNASIDVAAGERDPISYTGQLDLE